jgi:hypothetical protein
LKLKVKARLYIFESDWVGRYLVLEVKYKENKLLSTYKTLKRYFVCQEEETLTKNEFIKKCIELIKDIDIVGESIDMIKNDKKISKITNKTTDDYEKLLKEVSNFNTTFEFELKEEEEK